MPQPNIVLQYGQKRGFLLNYCTYAIICYENSYMIKNVQFLHSLDYECFLKILELAQLNYHLFLLKLCVPSRVKS